MTPSRRSFFASLSAFVLAACKSSPALDAAEPARPLPPPPAAPRDPSAATDATEASNVTTTAKALPNSNAEWKRKLTPEQYHVLREKGTERPFTGVYANEHRAGVYRCAACGQALFRSSEKFESGTGWPSFYDRASQAAVSTEADGSLWMQRTEVLCSRCRSHLGHVFDDGPPPTGLRYCINSVALAFEPSR